MFVREKNYDALRVLACFAVIILHVSSEYVTTNINTPNFHFTVGNFFDSFSRFCVPIFVMLSGAFILSNNKNINFISFFKKTNKTIIKPTIIWSIIFVIYSMLFMLFRDLVYNVPFTIKDYFFPIFSWIEGYPFYHLWYMYMIIGLYIVSPLLIVLLQQVGKKNFFLSAYSS